MGTGSATGGSVASGSTGGARTTGASGVSVPTTRPADPSDNDDTL